MRTEPETIPATPGTTPYQPNTPTFMRILQSIKEALRWMWPLETIPWSNMSADFHDPNYQSHIGVDMAVPVGTKVLAPNNGVLHYVYEGDKSWGTSARIVTKDADGTVWEVILGHLSAINADLKDGQTVSAGTIVGYSGGAKGAWGAGNTTGPHLDITIRRNGGEYNPHLIWGGGASPGTSSGSINPYSGTGTTTGNGTGNGTGSATGSAGAGVGVDCSKYAGMTGAQLLLETVKNPAAWGEYQDCLSHNFGNTNTPATGTVTDCPGDDMFGLAKSFRKMLGMQNCETVGEWYFRAWKEHWADYLPRIVVFIIGAIIVFKVIQALVIEGTAQAVGKAVPIPGSTTATRYVLKNGRAIRRAIRNIPQNLPHLEKG